MSLVGRVPNNDPQFPSRWVIFLVLCLGYTLNAGRWATNLFKREKK